MEVALDKVGHYHLTSWKRLFFRKEELPEGKGLASEGGSGCALRTDFFYSTFFLGTGPEFLLHVGSRFLASYV